MSKDDLVETEHFTLEEVCENCGLKVVEVTTYIQEGLIDVLNEDVSEWRFTETHLVRIQKASRLERDLRLNPAGVVLALELMSEIESLKKKIRNSGTP